MKLPDRVYKLRGTILGVFALALLCFPASKEPISVSAFLLFFCGFYLRVTARRSIGNHSRSNKVEAPSLVCNGIYQKMRHPLYLSNGLIASGFLLFHLNWQTATFVFATLLWLFLIFLANNEDKFLQETFGEEWELWASKTPFMMPSFKPSQEWKFNRSAFKAFKEDLWTWVFLLVYASLILLRRMF